jgi:hypothetical protein
MNRSEATCAFESLMRSRKGALTARANAEASLRAARATVQAAQLELTGFEDTHRDAVAAVAVTDGELHEFLTAVKDYHEFAGDGSGHVIIYRAIGGEPGWEAVQASDQDVARIYREGRSP